MSRINTNIQSMLAARILGQNTNRLNTSLERLSTGLRINTGKDDPAGLISSELLRSEKKAIGAAIDNARRADNVVATAEGALQEVSSLLIELEDLVDKSSSETGLNADQVEANQGQIDAILNSINRIANSTSFQGKKLLNGSLDYTTSGVATSALGTVRINSARIAQGDTRTVEVKVTNSAETAKLVFTGSAVSTATTVQIAGNTGIELFNFAASTTAADMVTAINGSKGLTGVSAYASGTGASTKIVFSSTEYGSDQFVTVDAISGTFAVASGSKGTTDFGVDVSALVGGATAIGDGLKATIRTASLSVDLVLTSAFAADTSNTKTFYVTGGGANFNIAPDTNLGSRASLALPSLSTGKLGDSDVGLLYTLGSGQTNQLKNKNFTTDQKIVREVSKQISSLRGRLGAFQKNTLQPSVNSLQVALENISAAEAAIRDTDFAEETSNLTRAQVLVQASTAVLQIANATPRNVLALLG